MISETVEVIMCLNYTDIMKSERNKTIDISIEEGRTYLDRCLTEKSLLEASEEGSLTSDFLCDKTINGDMMQIVPLLPEGSVDLMIADPPYNLSKDFHGNQFRKTTDDEYEAYTEEWIRRVLPLLKKDASVYVCCDWVSSGAVERVLKKYFTVRNRITWQREKGRGALSNWKNSCEDIWFATCSDDYAFHIDDVKVRRRVIAPYRKEGVPKDWEETPDGNFRDTCPGNFWDDISVPYWSMPENTAHPTQKPEKLLAKLILASSDPGDLVFDPFLGSGSASVTARKLSRHYLGIEQNPQYCVWAEKRLEMALTDISIQGYTDGVFWERNTHGLQEKSKKHTV